MSVETLQPSPEQLRPILHQEIDRLSDDDVSVLHRIALQLELKSVMSDLDEAFDADRQPKRIS